MKKQGVGYFFSIWLLLAMGKRANRNHVCAKVNRKEVDDHTREITGEQYCGQL